MRRGFTLIELMVVAGIMAFLGAAAVGGYNAYQRGMAERGATGAASSLLKAAKERALVDHAPTMVFCYNRLIREAEGDDENAIVVGEAVAVRRAGRITYASGDTLVDEFADIVGSYDIVDSDEIQKRKGMRLWKFDDRKMTKADYSVIADAVRPVRLGTKLQTYEGWADGETSENDAGADFASMQAVGGRVSTKSGGMTSIVYAFHVLSGGTINGSGWRVGTAYGFEFARVQLPHNYVFNGGIPTRLDGVEPAGVMYFDPDNMEDASIDVYPCRPDGSGRPQKQPSRAGQATSKGNAKI